MTEISVLVQHHAGPTGKVLICQSSDGAWTFPHGYCRTNETEEEAAERIVWEQLGLKVVVGKMTLTGHKKPADGSVEHIACGNITHNTHTKCNYHNYYEAVNKWQSEPAGNHYSDFQWIHPSKLGTIAFLEDDAAFMAKYDPWINGQTIPDRRMF